MLVCCVSGWVQESAVTVTVTVTVMVSVSVTVTVTVTVIVTVPVPVRMTVTVTVTTREAAKATGRRGSQGITPRALWSSQPFHMFLIHLLTALRVPVTTRTRTPVNQI